MAHSVYVSDNVETDCDHCSCRADELQVQINRTMFPNTAILPLLNVHNCAGTYR